MTQNPFRASGPPLAGYEWIRRLGYGGFADVHLYHQEVPSRDVAVKVVRSSADDAAIVELKREADLMTAVAGHPAIVQLHGVGTSEDGRPYLVMEYCPVADIGEQVRSRPLSIDRAVDMMIRISGGVEMLHRAGIVHRDIKPANLMIGAYGSPVLADFGIAARIGALEHGMLDGFSVLWAPPEQQDQRTHAHPTQDVWALATTTWTLLAGRSPFEDPLGDNSALAVASRVRSGRIRALGRADAPPELEEILRAAMAVDPVKRTRSAVDFGRALQGVQRLMGRPVTRIEVKDPDPSGTLPPGEAVRGGTASSSGKGAGPGAFEATRLRAMPSIDADRTRLRTPSYDFQTNDLPPADSWREPARAAAERHADEEEGPESKSGIRPWALVLLTAAAAAATTAVIIAMQLGTGKVTRVPQAPGVEVEVSEPVIAPPAPVVDLEGAISDGAVVWTWADAEESQSGSSDSPMSAVEGHHYIYTAQRPGADDVVNSVVQNSVTIRAIQGENCLEVIAVGENGRQSEPTRTCVVVP